MPERLPSPPATSDPITYIAITVVLALIGVLIWQLRVAAQERAEERKSREASLAAFRDECKAEREMHEKAVAAVRADHHEAIEGLHERLNGIQTDVTKIAARSAA